MSHLSSHEPNRDALLGDVYLDQAGEFDWVRTQCGGLTGSTTFFKVMSFQVTLDDRGISSSKIVRRWPTFALGDASFTPGVALEPRSVV